MTDTRSRLNNQVEVETGYGRDWGPVRGINMMGGNDLLRNRKGERRHRKDLKGQRLRKFGVRVMNNTIHLITGSFYRCWIKSLGYLYNNIPLPLNSNVFLNFNESLCQREL